MKRRIVSLLLTLTLMLGLTPTMSLAAKSTNTFPEAKVVRVVDGDTLEVTINKQNYKLRLIGVNTPETKHPQKGVEFFGKEASAYTTKELEGKTVYVQKDVSETDRYGRLLRYVWVERPATDEPTKDEVKTKMFNSKLVGGGYANVSTFPPDVKYQNIFVELEKVARDNSWGLWQQGQAPTSTPVTPKAQTPATQPSTSEVYVTNTGTKYHRGSCKYLKKSKIAISLDKAKASYSPCSVCKP